MRGRKGCSTLDGLSGGTICLKRTHESGFAMQLTFHRFTAVDLVFFLGVLFCWLFCVGFFWGVGCCFCLCFHDFEINLVVLRS